MYGYFFYSFAFNILLRNFFFHQQPCVTVPISSIFFLLGKRDVLCDKKNSTVTSAYNDQSNACFYYKRDRLIITKVGQKKYLKKCNKKCL